MNRIDIRRCLRPLAAVLDFSCEILLGIFGWLFISFFISEIIKDDIAYHFWLSWGIYAYAVGVFAIALRNILHQFKWYIRNNPSEINCPQCREVVPLTRYGEEQYLRAPIILYLETFRFQFIRIKQYFYWISYRPYLQLDCSHCGEKQIVCPYCHEVIPQELVECHYDKPSKCPHCGKKIYTPLPLQESNDLIEITTIAK